MEAGGVPVGLFLTGPFRCWWVVCVGTNGNGLGFGRYIERYRHKRWFPVNAEKLQQAQNSYQKYGRWSLLLSWVPIIGDPLTVVAGVMREPLWSFVLIVTFAKFSRYLVLVAITLGWVV